MNMILKNIKLHSKRLHLVNFFRILKNKDSLFGGNFYIFAQVHIHTGYSCVKPNHLMFCIHQFQAKQDLIHKSRSKISKKCYLLLHQPYDTRKMRPCTACTKLINTINLYSTLRCKFNQSIFIQYYAIIFYFIVLLNHQ